MADDLINELRFSQAMTSLRSLPPQVILEDLRHLIKGTTREKPHIIRAWLDSIPRTSQGLATYAGSWSSTPGLLKNILSECEDLEDLVLAQEREINIFAGHLSPTVQLFLKKALSKLQFEHGAVKRAARRRQSASPTNNREDSHYYRCQNLLCHSPRCNNPTCQNPTAITTLAVAEQQDLTPNPFCLLEGECLLLIMDLIHEDDTLCCALTCRATYEALIKRQTTRRHERLTENWGINLPDIYMRSTFTHADVHFFTRPEAVLQNANRLIWAVSTSSVFYYLHIDGSPGTYLCELSAAIGALDTLKLLRAWQIPWNSFTCRGAARNGHLKVLIWARNQGCKWDTVASSQAAVGGHLHILIWAINNGCALDPDICSSAARGGHLSVITWALQQQAFKWNNTIFYEAARGLHLDLLKWILMSNLGSGPDVPVIRAYGRTSDEIRRMSTGEMVPVRHFPWEWEIHSECPFVRKAEEENTLPCSYPFLMCTMAAYGGVNAVNEWSTYYGCNYTRAHILFLLAGVWMTKNLDGDGYNRCRQRIKAKRGLNRLLPT